MPNQNYPLAGADTPAIDGTSDDMGATADPAQVPMDDAAGGPTADKEQLAEEEAAAQLGDFA